MAGEDENDAAKKPPMILTVAVLAVMTALAGAGGWFLGNSLAPEEEPVVAAAEAHGGEEGEGEHVALVPQPVALEPITTNLAYPAERWVRLDISVLFDEPTEPQLVRTIHQDILAYMRTVSLQQLEGARGFQHLRADLTERAELRSNGKVSELLFRTFVIE